jgi:hypothetical protein
VVVYKLTVGGTVEERILALQERKRQLAEQAIDGSMKKDAFKLGVREMLALFRHEGGKDFVSQWEDGAGRGGNATAANAAGPLIVGNANSSRAASVEKDEEDDVVVRRRDGTQRSKGESGVYGRRW